MRFRLVRLVAALCALPVAGTCACDPFGLWSDGGKDAIQPPRVHTVVIESPTRDLDGLVDFARPDGAPCTSDDDDCVHVGRVRDAVISGASSCDGLRITDTLALFAWTCDDASGTAVAHGALRADKGLADVVDVDALALRENALQVTSGGRVIARSAPAAWWSTSVALASSLDVLDGEDVVYVMSAADGERALDAAATRVGIFAPPGEVASPVRAPSPNAFVWIEGTFAGPQPTLGFGYARWLLVRHVSALPRDGVRVEPVWVGGAHVALEDVRVVGATLGMRISQARDVRIEKLRIDDTQDGLLVSEVDGLVAHDVIVENSASSSIYLDRGGEHVWRNVILSANEYGVSGGQSTNVSFVDVTSLATDVAAFDVHEMTGLTVAGFLSLNDRIAVRINDGVGSSGIRVRDLAHLGDGDVSSFPQGEPADSGFEGAQLLLTSSPVVGGGGSDFVVHAAAGALTDPLARGTCADACVDVDLALTKVGGLVGALALEGSVRGKELERAREIAGDGDGRCEDGERCASAVNVGAYQGHGGFGDPRSATFDALTIELVEPEQNGL